MDRTFWFSCERVGELGLIKKPYVTDLQALCGALKLPRSRQYLFQLGDSTSLRRVDPAPPSESPLVFIKSAPRANIAANRGVVPRDVATRHLQMHIIASPRVR